MASLGSSSGLSDRKSQIVDLGLFDFALQAEKILSKPDVSRYGLLRLTKVVATRAQREQIISSNAVSEPAIVFLLLLLFWNLEQSRWKHQNTVFYTTLTQYRQELKRILGMQQVNVKFLFST